MNVAHLSVTKNSAYTESGVDIPNANKLVSQIARLAKDTDRAGRVNGIGAFAGLFDLSALSMNRPLLVASADGVGTKLLLAIRQGQLENIGQDLVAMCVNDILCSGAEPLFFLDYFSCGKLDNEQALTVIDSITRACKKCNCCLLGGETAEMPGMYPKGEFDLAGFCVGAVEERQVLGARNVKEDDMIIAIESSGPHSNGFSLIRQILHEQGSAPPHIMNTLLEPTTIYTPYLTPLIKKDRIHALAHITGGGLPDNLARVIPDHLMATVHCNWRLPEIFRWIAQGARLSKSEILDIYNGGVGMIAITAPEYLESVLDHLNSQQVNSWSIGKITARQGSAPVLLQQ